MSNARPLSSVVSAVVAAFSTQGVVPIGYLLWGGSVLLSNPNNNNNKNKK